MVDKFDHGSLTKLSTLNCGMFEERDAHLLVTLCLQNLLPKVGQTLTHYPRKYSTNNPVLRSQ